MKSVHLFAAGLLATLLALTIASTASASVRHTVAPGDTLTYLARVYVVTVGEIADANSIANPNLIFPGQDLLIPGDDSPSSAPGSLDGTYTVAEGDTLSEIANHFDMATADLQAANGLTDPNYLYIGQILRVPGIAATAPPASPEVPVLQFPSRPDNPEVEALIEEFSLAYGVDPNLVKALATVESAWNQRAVSSAGARGVMQIMPGTAESLETEVFGMQLNEDSSAYDNVKMGVKYLDILLGETATERDAVAAYYQGLSPTQQGVYYPDTHNYVATVFAVRLTYFP
jgi:LysM repeat protein